MAQFRNLIIGCDGTWNDASTPAVTNVKKLIDSCMKKNQEVHYEEGVGTAYLEKLSGGIKGKGLDRLILGGYRFLQRRFADVNYPINSNKVFIFGFSRGAYAARRLAGLITTCGIPRVDTDVKKAWNLYLKGDTDGIQKLKNSGHLFDISIEMLGVWDTVKSTDDPDFNDNKLPEYVVAGYHAIAIDEKRKYFEME